MNIAGHLVLKCASYSRPAAFFKIVERIALLFLLLLAFAVYAEETTKNAESKVAAADVRMLVDISGSMKINDPQNLRVPAIELMVELLPKGSKAGIWTFGQHIKSLVPYEKVDNKWREQAKPQVEKINSTGLFTNIGEALKIGAFDRNKKVKQPRHIILLTDGMVDISKDPDKNNAERERILSEQIPTLSQAGYTIHTIALSSNSDRALMDTLAIETGGLSSEANDADELTKLFLKALEQSAPAEQVPLQDNKFLVDSSVEEFTLLVFKPRPDAVTQLLSPDQALYSKASTTSDIKWHSSDQYDLVTVQKPYEGEWLLQAEQDPNNRVTIVSDLKLKVADIPSNLFLGQEVMLDFWFEEKGKTILEEEFLKIIKGTWRVYQEDQEVNQQSVSAEESLQEGHFIELLKSFPDVGDYKLELVVDANTFNRRYTKLVTVRRPFRVESELLSEDGQDKYLVVVKPRSQSIDRDATKVVAKVRYPDGTKQHRPVPKYKDGRSWRFAIDRLQQGQHKIFFDINTQTKDGKPLKIVTEPILLNYPDTQTAAVEGEVAPEQKEEVKPSEEKEEPSEAEKPEEEPPLDTAEEETEPDETEEEASEDELGWLTYVGIGLGNLLVLAGLFFAYKKLIKGGDEKEEGDETSSEKQGDDKKQSKDEKTEEPEPVLDDDIEELPVEEEEDEVEIELPADDLEDLTASDATEAVEEPPTESPEDLLDEGGEDEEKEAEKQEQDDVLDPDDLLNEDFDLSGGDEPEGEEKKE